MRTAACILALLVALMAAPASACRNPNPVQTLFDTPPAPLPYEGFLFHGRLTNQGDAFNDVEANATLTAGSAFVGDYLVPFAVLIAPGKAPMPVYAQLFSSCADLFGLYRTKFDREVWIVGRPVDPADASRGVFVMGQSARSGWNVQ